MQPLRKTVWSFLKKKKRKKERKKLEQLNDTATPFLGESESQDHSVTSDPLRPHGLYSSTVHGILQARILEWVAFPFYRESSGPRD